MSASVKIPVTMSIEEFLTWEPGDGRMWQLVDGEPQAMAPANRTHGAIQNELGAIIRNHLKDRNSPCTCVTTPGIVPRVSASHNVRIPDLAVTCSDYETEQAVLESSVLVIEILSVSNQAETWANVWTYTTIPTVQEILVVHTVRVRADLLRRRPDGTWPAEPETVENNDVVLDSIGLRVPVHDIYRTTRLRRPRNG